MVGGEQNRPAPKDDPLLDFFLGVDLVFFKGCRIARQCFLRDEGVVGSVFFFRKTPLPI